MVQMELFGKQEWNPMDRGAWQAIIHGDSKSPWALKEPDTTE